MLMRALSLYYPTFRHWIELRHYPNGWQLAKYASMLDHCFDTRKTYRTAIEEREKCTPNMEFTYGEIPFATLVDVLTLAKAQAGEIFYDLGSGDGRALFAALLIGSFAKVVGIERLPGLVQLSQAYCQQLDSYEYFNKAQVVLTQADYYACDLSEADIVYINATGIFGEDWAKLVDKFQQLKANARVITTSRAIETTDFELIDARFRPMSWGPNRVFIYQKNK